MMIIFVFRKSTCSTFYFVLFFNQSVHSYGYPLSSSLYIHNLQYVLCTFLADETTDQLRTVNWYNVYSVCVRYQSLRDVLGFRGITQGRRAQSRLIKCILAVCTTQMEYYIVHVYSCCD